MKKFLSKLLGGLNITWPKLIVFAILMGLYTAIVARFVPDGNSFHDIAVTPEWWVLPAIIIIVNAKKPLEAALKTFVFFLVSQPLVYLFQVPFSSMGWGLFNYYGYWFIITLLTFPAGFVGWFIKKDKWYSALILSIGTIYLAYTGLTYATKMPEDFPNHLLTTIYCFGIIPVFIFALFKDKIPRIICAALTVISLVVFLIIGNANKPFEAYNNTFITENNIVFVGDPQISAFSSEAQGETELIKSDLGYTVKLTGQRGKKYNFSISDEINTYDFEYYYDDTSQSVVIIKE